MRNIAIIDQIGKRYQRIIFVFVLMVGMYFLITHYGLQKSVPEIPIPSDFFIPENSNFTGTNQTTTHFNENKPVSGKSTVTIGLVICGDKILEAFTFLTSLVLFSRDVDLDLRIFQFEISQEKLLTRLKELQDAKARQQTKLSYRIYDTWLPTDAWYGLKPYCGTQRLFLQSVLPDVDKIIYMDADTLLFSNIYDLWSYFDLMDASQFAAMAPDGLPPAKGTYSSAKIPYYGPRGLNSGVLLMDLSRMRNLDFPGEMRMLLRGYRFEIGHFDQDLLNIYFHFHPQYLYLLPCEFNYGHQHCECLPSEDPGSCACKRAEISGISVLHGCNKQFSSKELNIFQQIFQIFLEYDLSSENLEGLLQTLKQNHENYKQLKTGKCSQLNLTIYSKLQEYVQQWQYR